MNKKKVSFTFDDTSSIIDTTTTTTPTLLSNTQRPHKPRERLLSDYDLSKAYQVGCRMAEELQHPERIHFRSNAEEHANFLLCRSHLYHHCSRIYRLDDKTLLQLCRALDRKK